MLYREEQSGEKTSDFYREQRREGRSSPLSNYAKRFYFELPRRRGTLLPASQRRKKEKKGKKATAESWRKFRRRGETPRGE